MKIQLFTNTEPPIQIIIEGRKYWFRPNEKGDLVCDVTEEHGRDLCQMFPNTYRRYDEKMPEPITEIIGDDFDIDTELAKGQSGEDENQSEGRVDADDTGTNQGDAKSGKGSELRPGHNKLLQRGATPSRKK